jgi:RNA polymerase sigma factor (sigma-70 family)
MSSSTLGKRNKPASTRSGNPSVTSDLADTSIDPKTTTERNLIRLALSDSALFETAMVVLWERYKKRLYLYAKYKLNRNYGNGSDQERYVIEDIIQSTFCDVLMNLNVYNPRFEVSTWIYNITNKHIVRTIRENQKFHGRTVGFDDTNESYYLSSDAIKPDQEFELKEFERIVMLFVQSLKAKADREVFLLYLQNLHTKNIAEMVGNTQDAVRARLNRVIKNLKKFLKKNYPEYLNAVTLSQIKNLTFGEIGTSAVRHLSKRGSHV